MYTRHFKVITHQRLTIFDHTHLGRRPAHIKRHQVAIASDVAVKDCRQYPRRRPRLNQAHWELGRGLRRGNATAGEHHIELLLKATGGQLVLQALDIAVGQGLDIGIADGRRHPLIFTDLWGDLTGEGDARFWPMFGQPGPHLFFMRGVGK